MYKFAFLISSVLLLLSGCWGNKPKYTQEELAKIPFAQRDGLPEASGGFVLTVGGETITAEEIITEPLLKYFGPIAKSNGFEQFKEQAEPVLERIIVNKVSDVLLYQKAKKDLGEQADDSLEKVADQEVKRFIVDFGGDYAKAEEKIKEMGMDWQSFKEHQKKVILVQWYISKQLPKDKPITYSEMMDCYNEMKGKSFSQPAKVTFRLIDIEFAKLKVTDPNKSQQQQAKDLADELVGRLKAGEDFGELAKKYSHDYRASFGGLWKPVQPDSLAKPYDVLAAEAEKIEPGQIAGPIEAGGHIFIMKLEEKEQVSVEPFEKVQEQVEAKIISDRQNQFREELGEKLSEQAAVANKNEFVDFCVEKIYRMSKV